MGLMASAGEPASVTEVVTDCLPQAFVDCLLDSTLEPVLDAAVERGKQAAKRKKNAGTATQIDGAEVARALLAVTVCDPACGSGSLLVAAALRIARRVAEAREGNQSPDAQSPEALRRAMREVVESCIYGVDLSGEAVEQARERLRLAADVPGMTPPFLDGRIRQGNALTVRVRS
jgi:type II restriction/modification system DNA methylase subunit YeeA